MTITVQRKSYTPLSTQGEMFLDGVHECYTLEPRRDQSQGKPYCIPAGTYPWSKKISLHFGFKTIWLSNVLGFTDIEIHPGNFPLDTHGCTLVGETEGLNYVGMSDAEFAYLMAKLPDSGQITYLDA